MRAVNSKVTSLSCFMTMGDKSAAKTTRLVDSDSVHSGDGEEVQEGTSLIRTKQIKLFSSFSRPLVATTSALIPGSGAALANCYTTSVWIAPDLLNCQQVGETNLGIPIWTCCN